MNTCHASLLVLLLPTLVCLACGPRATGSDAGASDAQVSDAGTDHSEPDAGMRDAQAHDLDAGGPVGGDGGTDSGVPTTYRRVEIDFGSVGLNEVVTDQFDQWVTFSSSDPALPHIVMDDGTVCGRSEAWGIAPCQSNSCPRTDTPDTVVEFTRPVRNVYFEAGCVNLEGVVGQAVLYRGDSEVASVPVVATLAGQYGDAAVLDLSGHDDITRVVVTQITDPYAMEYGALAFDFPE